MVPRSGTLECWYTFTGVGIGISYLNRKKSHFEVENTRGTRWFLSWNVNEIPIGKLVNGRRVYVNCWRLIVGSVFTVGQLKADHNSYHQRTPFRKNKINNNCQWPVGVYSKIFLSDFLIFFEGRMHKNKLRTERKSIEPSISSGNENEKWRSDFIKNRPKLIDVERSISCNFLAFFQ